MKKVNKISRLLTNIILSLFGYLWYFGLYIIIIPYILFLIGQNLDILFFQYFLNLETAVFYSQYISFPLMIIFVLAGLSLMVWSFYTLYFYTGCFPFSVLPSPFFNPDKLATYGPYKIIRHPMILGYLLLLVGAAIYSGSMMTIFWLIPLLSIASYEYILNREERRLAMWFGKEYDDYRKKTPFLLPKITK